MQKRFPHPHDIAYLSKRNPKDGVAWRQGRDSCPDTLDSAIELAALRMTGMAIQDRVAKLLMNQ